MFCSVDAILMNDSSTKLTEDIAFHLTRLLQNKNILTIKSCSSSVCTSIKLA